jgi:uncharacterized protein YecE (DUF72 family)
LILKVREASFIALKPEDLRIGCSGWSYSDWQGVFYPKGLPSKDYLEFYSGVFNCVEIDSTFYRTPSPFIVSQWNRNTPQGFLFSPKLPKKITHEAKLKDSEASLLHFNSLVHRLGSKLGPIVIQLPPSIKLGSHLDVLEKFLSILSPDFKHAVEFRHRSWFTPEVYRLLAKSKVAMVWSLNQYVETPPEATADFLYLRMVGDRELTSFKAIQKDRLEEMKRWADATRSSMGKFESGFVFFNNHFAGFSPESTNEFRRLLGLMELDWRSPGGQQQTLFGG